MGFVCAATYPPATLICREPGRAVRFQCRGSSRTQLHPGSSVSLKSSRKKRGSGVGVSEAVGVVGVEVAVGIRVAVAEDSGVICIEGSVGGAGIKLHAEKKKDQQYNV